MNKFIFGLGWVYNKNTLDLVHVSSHPNPILWHVRAMCAQDAMPTGGNLPIKGGWEGGGSKELLCCCGSTRTSWCGWREQLDHPSKVDQVIRSKSKFRDE